MSLYHYTNAQAVYSILNNRSIWLTDIRFLNDTEELHDGLTMLEETLINHVDVDVEHKYKDQAINAIQHSLINTETAGMELEPLFVFSLSSEKDQLSQWRAYGSYAIEFDQEILKDATSNISTCIYDLLEKVQRSTSEVEKSTKIIANEIETNSGSLGPNSIDALIDIVYGAATFKHDGFKEEKESRILMQANDTNPVKYRVKNEILIPYIEIEIPLDCVKSIQVGPMENQDLAYMSMSDYALQVEREWQNETSNIEYWLQVEKSPIPYRA